MCNRDVPSSILRKNTGMRSSKRLRVFEVDKQYFCNICRCSSYTTSIFYTSFLKKEIRVCVNCIEVRQHQKQLY